MVEYQDREIILKQMRPHWREYVFPVAGRNSFEERTRRDRLIGDITIQRAYVVGMSKLRIVHFAEYITAGFIAYYIAQLITS